MKVYLVYIIYNYDGYDNLEVYNTREKAIEAADKILFKLKQDGYKINPDYADEDIEFKDFFNDNLICIRLGNKDRDVEITLEEKIVR